MNYKVVKSAKRKSVGISIHANGEVIIKVPSRLAKYKIEEIINKRQEWITSKLVELDAKGFFVRNEKKYENGEEFCFLGKKYVLCTVDDKKNYASIYENKIFVYTNGKKLMREILIKFFNEKAHEVFSERMKICFEYFHHFFACELPKLRVRKMKSRWGSCSSRSVVTLNSMLVHTSVECIDYVIFHELCHLKHRNHSSDFYAMQTQVNPSWKGQKSTLESFMGEVASMA
jgi:predicted metal-dependent hydrolase